MKGNVWKVAPSSFLGGEEHFKKREPQEHSPRAIERAKKDAATGGPSLMHTGRQRPQSCPYEDMMEHAGSIEAEPARHGWMAAGKGKRVRSFLIF